MTITRSSLMRGAGICAIIAGTIFAGIQPIHPPDVLASVTTDVWAIITPIKTLMTLLFLLGITGIYARQVDKVGLLGLIGYLVVSLSWALNYAFIYAETFIFPILATPAPTFVEGALGIINGKPIDTELGALPILFGVTGITYMLGGLLFGVATFRAGVLPRGAAGLLAAASALTPLAALLPHEIQRFAAIPVAIAWAWMGYALWAERRAKAGETLTQTVHPQIRQREAS
jgi:hypothetical protein